MVLSPRLGDSLLLMSLAHNLHNDGRDLVIFSTQISALKRWFPWANLHPIPREEDITEVFGDFDAVIQLDVYAPLQAIRDTDITLVCFTEWYTQLSSAVRATASPGLVGDFELMAKTLFGVTKWTHSNGMVAPASLKHHAHPKRVIIHPTASTGYSRYWPQKKYARLAQLLIEQGYAPEFVVERHERADWLEGHSESSLTFVNVDSLDALASYIHESGWFIGSDSGIGHLSSSTGIPTVTICERIRNLRRWRPTWAAGEIAQPIWLPLRSWRRRYWREAITIGRVLTAFRKVRATATSQPARYGAMNTRREVPAQ